MSLDEALRDFLAYMDIERGYSTNTIEGYRVDLQVLFRYLQVEHGLERVSEIEPRHIRHFLAYVKTERRNCNKTMARKLSVIKSFFAFLLKEGRLDRDPSRGFDTIRFPRRLPVFLSREEAEDFLEAAGKYGPEPTRDFALFLLMLQCGLRVSEVTTLTLDCLDLENGMIRVTGKGAKERLLPLTSRTVRALEAYLKERPSSQHREVFLNRRRRPLTTDGVRHIFRRIVSHTYLKDRPHLTVHKLRHTCLTLLLQQGVDLRTLQHIAGHASVATTQIYTHVTQEQVRSAMEKHPLG